MALAFWEEYWGTPSPLTTTEYVSPNSSTSTMEAEPSAALSTTANHTTRTITTMAGHPFIPGPDRMLIRDDYITALEATVKWAEQRPKAGMVIIGHPGSGE